MDYFYRPHQPHLWRGRTDEDGGKRWRQVIQPLDLRNAEGAALNGQPVLLGFMCDEGVRRNKGRTGAAEGPESLRRSLASLAWPGKGREIAYDAGDILCPDDRLEEAQERLGRAVAELLQYNGFPLILGGGHETAFGSYRGLREALGRNHPIGIINIDAHFDLRQPQRGASSGTPFWQISRRCQETNTPFSYCCIGINPAVNTATLFAEAHRLGVSYFPIDDCLTTPEALKTRLADFLEKQQTVYLTIDLDAFDAAYAPGVSAPASPGLSPAVVIPMLRQILASGKLALMDICELNPGFDSDGRTARLAAGLVNRMVNGARPPMSAG